MLTCKYPLRVRSKRKYSEIKPAVCITILICLSLGCHYVDPGSVIQMSATIIQ